MYHLKSRVLPAVTQRFRASTLLLCLALFSSAALAADPGDFASLSQQAAAAREANNIPAAVDLYQRATALNPKWDEGWWWLGSLQYDANQYLQAIDALHHLTALDEHNSLGFGLLGLCEWETGAHRDSLRDIQQALQLAAASKRSLADQMEGVLRYHQGLLLAETGKFDDALRSYGWFVGHGVHHDTFLTALGMAALHLRGTPETLPPETRDAALDAGRASYLSMSSSSASGSSAEALAAFQELAAKHGDMPFAHFLYALLLMAKDPDGAVTELSRELAVAPHNGTAHALLAYLEMQDGDMAAAIPHAQAAAADDPDAPLTRFVAGRALVETGQVARGIQSLQRAVELAPGNLANHIALAAAYAKAGQSVQARAEREQAEALAKGSADVARR